MRLDLFLKVTRLCHRRTVAQKLCEAGLVLVGDRIAKSAQSVKPGDEITITRRDRITKVRVKAVPETRQVARKDATDFLEVLRDELREFD